MLKTFKVAELQPGMMVSNIVSQHGPVKIRKVGMIRSPEMVKGLTEMGVTEVEVDLDQSLGLSTDEHDDIEPVKLTPTQQLLQNERQTAKVNVEQSQHYNRSLFMPSLDSLPSTWTLYGKNISILLLLIVGGLSVGWNVASIPQWMSLTKNQNHLVIDYQPTMNSPSRVNDANGASPSNELNSGPIANSAENTDNSITSNSDLNGSANRTLNDKQANAAGSNNDTVAQATQASEPVPEPEPLVLGYQPDNISEVLAADRLAESQNDALNSSTDPAVTAALLNKINQAIAELDNKATPDESLQQSTNYDDLPRIDQLSIALQTQIPSMSFSAHMYSSSRDGRWVRVNGRRLVEGDYIAEDLQLVNIEPQKVILMFKEEVFSMNALTDW